MGDTGETRDRVGAAGVAIASVFFKIALYICVIVLLFWIGKSAFQFGHDVFNQQAMSPGEGQEVTVVIKEEKDEKKKNMDNLAKIILLKQRKKEQIKEKQIELLKQQMRTGEKNILII